LKLKTHLPFLDTDAEGSSLYEANLRHAAYAALTQIYTVIFYRRGRGDHREFLDTDAEGSNLYEAKLRHAAYAAFRWLRRGTFSKSILVYAYILME
jgi:uncharacterized protein YjbI with pentapeptide repeats